MTEQKNNKKSSMGIGCVLIRIAAVLFCLVVVSTYLMSGLFARYVAKGTGSDSARVAGFEVQLSGVMDGVEYKVSALAPGTIAITLNNQSEVAVSYKIRVDAGSPAGGVKTTWLKADGTNDEVNTESGEKKFNAVRYMPVGGTDTCTLTFTAVDWTQITKEVSGKSAMLTQEFTVYVDVVQVD